MPIEYKVRKKSIFYLWVIYGREGVDGLAIPQELGNEVCPLGVKLVGSVCNKSSIVW